jgi:DNA-binding HxlR family transcriptional regulator
LSKEAFDETLPRVEYRLTPAGRKLIPLLARIRDLGGEFGP